MCSYTQYANGYRYYNGQWLLKSRKNYSYAGFRRYLDLVFCNIDITSLLKDLKTVDRADSLKAGDVFIKDNSPAHCFMVMDVIENDHHIKRFLLAQGFTPAQDIQIVQYNSDEWFYLGKPCDMLYGELISKKFLRCFRD